MIEAMRRFAWRRVPARQFAHRSALLMLTFFVLALGLPPRIASAAAGPAGAGALGQAIRALADTPFDPAGRNADPPLDTVPSVFAQDGAGLLWAGGQSGLFRWDGYAITKYVAGARHPDGLADHQILALHRDRQGVLWVGTATGGLARYAPRQDHFVSETLVPHGGAALAVRDIADDGAGGLLIASSAGLIRRSAKGEILWRLDPAAPSGLPASPLRAVLLDRENRIWIGGDAGLAVSTPLSRSAQPVPPRFTPVPLAASDASEPAISHLLQDAAGAIWIGTHEGALVLPAGAATPRHILIPGDALAARETMAMAEMRPGEVWIGTYGEGIIVARADGTERRILHDPMQAKGLDSSVVFGLFRDSGGLPWVSTPFGISHAQLAQDGAVLPLFDHPKASAGLTVEQPTALLARKDGSLWIGSEADGIEILDPAGKVAGHVPVQPVVTLAEMPDGRVFAGGRGGAYVIEPGGGHAARLEVPGRGTTDTVWVLTADGDRLWLGGDTDGVWVLRLRPGGQAETLAHLPVPQGETARIAAIAPAPDGRMAVATSRGLWLVDRSSYRRTLVMPDAKRNDALPSGALASLAIDNQNRLWVGTVDAGLAILTGWAGGTAHFTTLGIEDGLINPDIDGMLPDARGRMWVSTDAGINIIDTASLAVRGLSAADGVAVSGFWTGSAARTQDGVFLFGGTGGLLAIDPGLLGGSQAAAPVVITRVTIGGKPALAWQDGVTLPPGTAGLGVDFAALDYAEPGRNRYRYWLDGFDTDWIQTDAAHRAAAYTNLPPGDYTLWLDGTDHAGNWSPALAQLRIRVQPVWYATLAFRLALAAAIIGGVVALMHLRTRLLRRQQRLLEQEVAERTAALRESEARLERLAHLDVLTALPNRRAFNTALARACGRQGGRFALAIVDLDGFKLINDTLGHHAGDALLLVVAARLRNAVRTTDFVARLGGDEFAILLSDVEDVGGAEQTCERVVRELGETVLLRDRAVCVGASVGLALYPRHGAYPDALHKAADLAMYDAKRAGRGTWRWFREAVSKAS